MQMCAGWSCGQEYGSSLCGGRAPRIQLLLPPGDGLHQARVSSAVAWLPVQSPWHNLQWRDCWSHAWETNQACRHLMPRSILFVVNHLVSSIHFSPPTARTCLPTQQQETNRSHDTQGSAAETWADRSSKGVAPGRGWASVRKARQSWAQGQAQI